MSALHKSLDETLAAIREQHNLEMQECKDRTAAAEIRAAILEKQLDRAVEARAAAERFSMKLVTQFAVVETVFAEAKELALQAADAIPAKTEKMASTEIPTNEMGTV